jgi:hypothetical protein
VRECSVLISARIPANMTEAFRRFYSHFKGMVLWLRHDCVLPSTLQFVTLEIILTFDAIQSDVESVVEPMFYFEI